MKLKFKTIKEVDQAIEQFCNISSKDYASIERDFFKLFGFYPLAQIEYPKNIFETLSTFRARTVNDVVDDTNISEFSYPPLDLELPIQRASWTGRNVFYASDLPYTSLIETKIAHEGNNFYVAEWSFNLNKLTNYTIPVSSLAIDNMSSSNPWKVALFGQKKINLYLKKNWNLSDKEADIYSYLTKKLSLIFTDLDENKYPLTAFIADKGIYFKGINKKNLFFPILIFPSVANNKNNCNFAIHPIFVNNYMHLTKVVKVKITDRQSGNIKISISKIGIPISEKKIMWYKISFERQKLKYRILSIKCGCGEKIDVSNLDKLIFKKENNTILINDLIKEVLQDFDYEKMYQLDDIFNNKELITAISFEIKNFCPVGVNLYVNELKHTNFIINFELEQPLTYSEIK